MNSRGLCKNEAMEECHASKQDVGPLTSSGDKILKDMCNIDQLGGVGDLHRGILNVEVDGVGQLVKGLLTNANVLTLQFLWIDCNPIAKSTPISQPLVDKLCRSRKPITEFHLKK